MTRFRRILVPVDGSPTSTQALATAIVMAADSGGRLRIVHSVDEPVYLGALDVSAQALQAVRDAGTQVLEAALADARIAGVPAESHLTEPQPLGEAVATQARAWNADLIVVGSHGRRGMGRLLLGSGAEQIIRSAPVSVLVVRAGDGESKAPP